MYVYGTLQKLYQRAKRREEAPQLFDIPSEHEIEDFKTVQYYLNHFEIIAIGIDNKILDEKFYKNWMKNNFIATWKNSEELIRKWREEGNYDKYFNRLEHYAEKWRLGRFRWYFGRLFRKMQK